MSSGVCRLRQDLWRGCPQNSHKEKPIMNTTLYTQWFPYLKPVPTATMRLFCFPYAGGGASIYRSWNTALAPTIEVCAVQLPGRETRMVERAFHTMPDLIAKLRQVLLPLLDRPFAFFGHSMGALIAFELTRTLRAAGDPLPQTLFLSAHRAAHLPDAEPPIYHLPDEEFLDGVRALNGTPDGVLDHPELRALLLPLLRADFTLCETYQYEEADPLPCPIVALGGITDYDVPRSTLDPWREHTSADFSLRLFRGDHFYLHHHHDALHRLMWQQLCAPSMA